MSPTTVLCVTLIVCATVGRGLWLLWQAYPQSPARYKTYAKVTQMEELSPRDVLRNSPYNVTLHLGSKEHGKEGLTCAPRDAQPASLRSALRTGGHIPVWLDFNDTQNIAFLATPPKDVDVIRKANTWFATATAFALVLAIHHELILTRHWSGAFVYLLAIGICTQVAVMSLRRFSIALSSFSRRRGVPRVTFGRIEGVVQRSAVAGSIYRSHHVSVAWQPAGHPTQVGTVIARGYSRRNSLLLQKLIAAQLEEPGGGAQRVPVEAVPPLSAYPGWGPPVGPEPLVRTFNTPDGPSDVRITPVESEGAGARDGGANGGNAGNGSNGAKGALEDNVLTWSRIAEGEASTIIRKAKAAPWSFESAGSWINRLIDLGPLVWYYPKDPGTPHLLGVDSYEPGALSMRRGLRWGLLGLVALAGLIWAGWDVSPFYPHHIVPSPQELRLGPIR
ncbi:MAG: hypothetical protein Q4G30_01005 [Actinomycetaceae bacterium]|nr:hypothetical protein [Actinomycetaceae bacterium]